jgi:hypothetical protein
MKNVADLTVPTNSLTKGSDPAEGGFGKAGFIAYVLIALVAIFYVPRLIPTAPSASDSYLFGYNNRVGIILLFLFVAVGAIWTKGLGLVIDSRAEPKRLQRGMLLSALVVVGIACAAMYLFAGRYNGFGESFYLIDRIWLTHVGKVPYRDLEFAYGPAQLYGPLFLSKLLHIGVPQSYYLFWAISYLFGTYFLLKCVELIDLAAAARRWIFLLLFATGLFGLIRMGTNYTFLRYALPVYLVIQTERQFRSRDGRSILLDVILSGAFSGILVLLSPETAIAYAFASLCICLLARSTGMRMRGITAGALVITYAALFLVALKLHVLDTMLADGGGAISFPIVPSPTILIYFVALFICACYLYRCIWAGSTDASTLGLVFFSIPMVAAALGRCDPSHVFWNGLAAFLASLVYLSTYRRAWITYSSAFVMFVLVAPNLSELYLFVPQLRLAHSYNQHPDLVPAQQRIEHLLSAWNGDYIAPFGFRPGGFETYHSSRIEFGKFEDLIDVSTPHSIAEKVEEMQTKPTRALILPYHADEYCRRNQRNERHYLETLLLSPYIGTFIHTDFVRAPICRYMDENYRMLVEPSSETFWYGIYAPKGANH